jgi:hypothetical protein
MTILAIDPGTTESAWVLYDADAKRPLEFRKERNDCVLHALRINGLGMHRADQCVVEMVASYGMAVGAEVFNTVKWIGRFVEAFAMANRVEPDTLERRPVKLHLCNSAKAKDGNIRQALIDRFGGKDKAIGSKKNPGPLYGVSGDVWQALALAVTYAETRPHP